MTDGVNETVMERTGQEDIRLVRFLYADHGGIVLLKMQPGAVQDKLPAGGGS